MDFWKQRDEISKLVDAGAARDANVALADFWQEHKDPAAAAFVISCYESLKERLPLLPYRLAILRSFTIEPIVPLLRAAAFVGGIDLSVHVGDFNAYAQEILDGASQLYVSKPDVTILAVQTRDVAPDLWRRYADLEAEAVSADVRRVKNSFRDWIRAFRARSQAHLIVHTLEHPLVPSKGLLDAQEGNGQYAAIHQVNQELRALAQESRGTYILDYDALVGRFGRATWGDERKWLSVRLPIAGSHLIHLAEEWLRFLHPLTGKIAKALVVDLDNTLWGGIIGEDGMEGIQIGAEYPGAAFQSLQRAILDLYRRGILLVVCSKNNPDDAMAVLERHPEMLLRPHHFAAMKINWADKPQNLRAIAAELNIGTDSLALLDDNAVERNRVRLELPEVTVIQLPEDPMWYEQSLRDCPAFERLTLTAEDQERPAYYVAERERAELEQRVASREDFLRNLRQEAEIAPVTAVTLARAAQLTQKTNQFNLTTRRYSEQDISQMASVPEYQVLSIRVKDRFADNGLVGIAVTRDKDGVCEIDTFLLSCRVIGRSVETALLSHLVDRARARGMRSVQGWFLPTKKNAPAREFYAGHGFTMIEQNEMGSLWGLDLSGSGVSCPEWIAVVTTDGNRR